ncbi:helix-turn-helix domain-containing protein [Paenibacillus sp. NPDC093718]|uniref:helix-turn-helix domain-containing protein n=1 Tax=Paenibacillus sp. NPDC093718 TaxID=3390601 RepID=UPI003D02275F
MFGDYIRKLRTDKGITQTEVAERAGMQIRYLSRIENNHDNPPSEEILLRLAAALDEDPHQMVVKAGKVPSDFKELIAEDDEVFRYLKHKVEDRNKSEG